MDVHVVLELGALVIVADDGVTTVLEAVGSLHPNQPLLEHVVDCVCETLVVVAGVVIGIVVIVGAAGAGTDVTMVVV